MPRVALDRRLWRRARSARAALTAAVVLGAATALLVIAQAWLLAGLIAGPGPLARRRWRRCSRSCSRAAALAWLSETVAARCSARVKSELRGALLRAGDGAGRAGTRPGRSTTLATRGIDALDGYFARYLPQAVLAVIVPALVVAGRAARATGSRR